MDRQCQAPPGRYLAQSVLSTCHQLLLLLLQTVVAGELMAKGAKLCTKVVQVEGGGKKKVSVLRRVPASCSNWDKAWAWITTKDCGTKYRLDLVEVQSPQVISYRVVNVCCPGDQQCERTQGDGLDLRTLLIWVIGAVLTVVFFILITIWLIRCRKMSSRTTRPKRSRELDIRGENVSTYEENESVPLTPNDEDPSRQQEKTTQSELCESAEYAEIHVEAAGLPSYDDIFRYDHQHVNSNSILQPTAPPIWLYDSRADDVRTPVTKQKQQQHEAVAEGEVCQEDSDMSLFLGLDSVRPFPHQTLPCKGRVQKTTNKNDVDNKQPLEEDASVVYYNQAVYAVTQDAPVVLTGGSSLSSPEASSVDLHLHSMNSRGHEENKRDKDSDGDVSCACRNNSNMSAQYATLADRGSKDCHDYQQLSTPHQQCQ